MGLAGSQQMGKALVNSGIFADPMLHDGASVNFQLTAPFLQFQVLPSTGNDIDLPSFFTFRTPVENDIDRDVVGRHECQVHVNGRDAVGKVIYFSLDSCT